MVKNQERKAKGKGHSFRFAAQPGAQGDAGLRFGLFPPGLVRPRPLARALGVRVHRFVLCLGLSVALKALCIIVGSFYH